VNASARRQLIVVSNRGPVSFGRDEAGARVVLRGGGGLVTALRGLTTDHDVTWIASAMSDEDRAVVREAAGEPIAATGRHGAHYDVLLLAHDPAAYAAYYGVVSNATLWFVHHYLWGLGHAPSFAAELRAAWHDGYEQVNRSFAEAVVAELERDPGAGKAVMIHDYHLYLAPRFVRERAPDALLSQFIHVPWAEPEYWHTLPEELRAAIHAGMLANDVVGFHTERWRRNFLQSCESLLGAECDFAEGVVRFGGRETRAVSRPISIDPAEFDELAQSPAVLDAERAIVAARPELLVVRVDRTDLSKNIVRGFQAFELLFERHPELHRRVQMLALLDPSRQDLEVYAEYRRAVEATAAAVNARFGDAGWVPIDLQIADNFPQAVAAYKQYDALFVNAVYDGMNLVAKEAPLANGRDGVLILSENAGAHEELGEWAVTVNPFDLDGQADALYEALTMPADERRRRASAIREFVREHDIARWTRDQLADLDRAAVASSAI
jgi:trehalose 6-phosphate synthase